MMKARPIVLCIADGWGLGPSGTGNAIEAAQAQYFSYYWRNFAHSALAAAGKAVGLPEGQAGNSEVGHLNIGAGKIPELDFEVINRAIRDGSFFSNPILLEAISKARERDRLHIIGLLSDRGVHGQIDHIEAILDLAKKEGLKELLIHIVTDGRDTGPDDALSFIGRLEQKMRQLSLGRIASVIGRFYAMDRDRQFDRTEVAFKMLTTGQGRQAGSAAAAVSASYRESNFDERIEPTVVSTNDAPFIPIKDEDVVIFTNFRADRIRQLCRAIVGCDQPGLELKVKLKDLFVVSLSPYDRPSSSFPVKAAFGSKRAERPLGFCVSKAGLKQLRIVETEKYAHVTYFLNGNREEPYLNEDRILIPSAGLEDYSQKPEMSAPEITKAALSSIQSKKYDLIIVNLANADIVGHTGNFPATVRAIGAVDRAFGAIAFAAGEIGAQIVFTADHGNAEMLVDPITGRPSPQHTKNPTPFILADPVQPGLKLRPEGRLSNIAPTILKLFGIERPAEMDRDLFLDPMSYRSPPNLQLANALDISASKP